MFPFISPDAPDQFYRLFTSLCLHAGIIHLVITVAFQHIFLTDLERLLGPIRTAILYVGSGVGGNLISAIFLPYKPEVSTIKNTLIMFNVATMITSLENFHNFIVFSFYFILRFIFNFFDYIVFIYS